MSAIADIAESFAGVGVATDRTRYVALLLRASDPPQMSAYYALPQTSGCALATSAFWRAAGVAHPLLRAAYRVGHATADMIAVARDLRAYHSFAEVSRGTYVPKRGDAVLIVQPEHAYTIAKIDVTPHGWVLESIDGGQIVQGQQAIKRKSRLWWRKGAGVVDAPSRERARDVACVIDGEALIASAPAQPVTGLPASNTPPGAPYGRGAISAGVDVSAYQQAGAVDWKRLAASQSFAIVRASNGLRKDGAFVHHVAGARSAGLTVGAYHFLWQDVDALAQLAMFREQCDAARIGPGDILPAVDLEDDGPRDMSVYVPRARAFVEALVSAYGGAIVYTGPDFYARMGSPDWLRAYPLWVAHYTERPEPAAPWPWSIWQYTGTGRVDGYGASIDRNRARELPLIGAQP